MMSLNHIDSKYLERLYSCFNSQESDIVQLKIDEYHAVTLHMCDRCCEVNGI